MQKNLSSKTDRHRNNLKKKSSTAIVFLNAVLVTARIVVKDDKLRQDERLLSISSHLIADLTRSIAVLERAKEEL